MRLDLLLQVCNGNLVAVLLRHGRVDVRLEHIYLRRGELAGAHALLEEQVQLGKSAARGLRYPEVGVDQAQEANAGLRVAQC